MSDFNCMINKYVIDSARNAARDMARSRDNRLYSDYYYVFTQEELNLFLKFLKKFGGEESNIVITNVYGDCSDEFYCYQVSLK